MMRRNAEMNGKGCSITGKVFENGQMTEEPKSVGISFINYGSFHTCCFVAPKYASYLQRYLNVKRQKEGDVQNICSLQMTTK